jgi:hypothetical protein
LRSHAQPDCINGQKHQAGRDIGNAIGFQRLAFPRLRLLSLRL